MSKVVKKVTRGIKKVVKGVKKGISKVWKKIKKNKIFRAVATAALVYFGGAALMGGFSGMSAGTGFFSGAGQGIANAWGGLTGAASSAWNGQWAQAGSQLGQGALGRSIDTASGAITGAGGQALGTSNAFVNTAAEQAANVATTAGQQAADAAGTKVYGSRFGPAVNDVTGEVIGEAARQSSGAGLLQEGSRAWYNPLGWSKEVKGAAIMTGGRMFSGVFDNMSQQAILDEQRAEEERARLRYGQNMGTKTPEIRWNPETRRYEVVRPANESTLPATDYGYPNFGRRAQGVLG